MHETGPKLIDTQELLERYPALRSRGKKPSYRLEWLVRQRVIPLVKIGRRNYFSPEDIDRWIDSQKVPATGVK